MVAPPRPPPGPPPVAPNPPPPPGPVNELSGPALGIAPVCAVEAVCRAYAVGANSKVKPIVIAVSFVQRRATTCAVATAPANRMIQASHGCQVLRPRSSNVQTVLATRIVLIQPDECHRTTTPIATKAAMAGANATV